MGTMPSFKIVITLFKCLLQKHVVWTQLVAVHPFCVVGVNVISDVLFMFSRVEVHMLSSLHEHGAGWVGIIAFSHTPVTSNWECILLNYFNNHPLLSQSLPMQFILLR